jgi:phage gpG-like protein
VANLRFPLFRNGLFGVYLDASEAVALATEMQRRLAERRTLFLRVGSIARKAFRRNFAQGGPGWMPLAASTVAQKAGLGLPSDLRTPAGRLPRRLLQNGALGASNILIRTGALRDALSQRGARGNLTEVDEGGVFVGVNPTVFPWAAVHEFGGDHAYLITPRQAKALAFMGSDGSTVIRRSVLHPPLPRRPMTTLSANDIEEISRAGAEWLRGGAASLEITL